MGNVADIAANTRPKGPAYKKPIKRRRGDPQPEPYMAAGAAGSDDGETSTEEQEQAQRRAIIESRVAEYVREAVQARETSGIEEVWQDSEDLYNGVDAMSVGAAFVKTRDQAARSNGTPGARSRILPNITKPKTDSAAARVQEMLVPHDERPFGIAPTPLPELDHAIEQGDPGATVATADGAVVPAAVMAQHLKDVAATDATAAEDWVHDLYIEGRVYGEMRHCIKDSARIGTGVLMGPIPITKINKKWTPDPSGKGSRLQRIRKQRWTSRRVRAQDCFPDPAAGMNPHDGSYFVYRDHFTPRQMRRLADDPDYDRAAVARVLAEGPKRGVKALADRTGKLTPGETVQDAALFEAYFVYCDVAPRDLIAMGMSAEDDFDATELELDYVPAILTMVNGQCIKCKISPDESGDFPFDFFVWDQIEGQPWGRGVPYKMSTAQKGCTASCRALMENAGMSKGPIVVMADGVTPAGGGQYEITGRQIFTFTPTEAMDDARKAVAVFNIPSMQESLLAIIQFFLNMADQLTNLPMLMQGEQQAGTSPETLGGMRLLMANASSPLRVLAKQHDDQLMGPHTTRYYEVGRQYGEVDGDMQIQPKGASVLVQRDEAQQFLMSLFAVKDDPSMRINPAKLGAAMAKANGFDLASIQYSDDEWKKIEAQRPAAPPDPRIEAAQIKAKTDTEIAGMKVKDAEADRVLKQMLANIERDIEAMRLAGTQHIELDKVKAMLAKSAMDNRQARDEMQLKLSPANVSHEGI